MVIRRIPDKVYKALGTQQASSSEGLVTVTGLGSHSQIALAGGCHTSAGNREISALGLWFPGPASCIG